MTELKNCPFCGDNNVKPYNLLGQDTDYAVACCNIDCGAEGPDKDTEEAAIKAWNTRTDWWIPVSERLPEDDSLTLIYDEVSQRTYLGRLEWGDWFYKGVKCYPTHWRPLPAPPEEE